MKKVLLLGDSIRLGYCGHVKELLTAEAELFYPDDNCRYTQYTLVSLPNWIRLAGDPESVDLVHWNNGHWDMAHWDGETLPLNTPQQYGEMLERIYGQLRKRLPNAKIIFATTTPINPTPIACQNPRSNGDVVTYNAVARGVMEKLGAPVNDLHALMADKPSSFFIDHAHFTAEGYKTLADAVVKTIRQHF